jgi:uroporphyrinogen-III synthase
MFKKVISLFKIFFGALDQLSESQLNELAAGKLTVKFEELKEPAKHAPKTETVPAEVCEKVNTFTSREEAREYLENLNYKKSQLTEIAQYYKIFVVSKDTKARLIAKIIEGVVGSKLRFEALLDSD